MKIKRIEPRPKPKFKVTLSEREVEILAGMLGTLSRAKYLEVGFTDQDYRKGYDIFDLLDEAAKGSI